MKLKSKYKTYAPLSSRERRARLLALQLKNGSCIGMKLFLGFRSARLLKNIHRRILSDETTIQTYQSRHSLWKSLRLARAY